jgi:hypothetical protein
MQRFHPACPSRSDNSSDELTEGFGQTGSGHGRALRHEGERGEFDGLSVLKVRNAEGVVKERGRDR